MRISNIFFALALVVSAGGAHAGPISIISELDTSPSGLTGSVDVVEIAGSPLNHYNVANNLNGDLIGLGVSAIDSTAALLDVGLPPASPFGCNSGSPSNFCYEARVLTANNWGFEVVNPSSFVGSSFTFQAAFGDFSNYVSGSENTINWYHSIDGSLLAGQSIDGFFAWESVLIASNIIGIGETGNGTAAFGAGQATVPGTQPVVPLPAAGWMLLAGIGGLVALRRRARVS
jgi:hypothetical protein